MSDNHWGLFDVTGVEAEYMIVESDTNKILPITDKLLFEKTGAYLSDAENETVDWSNELVNHVVEIKTAGPVLSLEGIDSDFHKNIIEINRILKKFNAKLLPTASHPMMNPLYETSLWPHDFGEIYELFDRVFDCKSHGWANLQSIHINLPFKNDSEFAKLHSAIRFILPLIPGVSASSPLREGKLTGYADSRMEAYLNHERKVPSLMGKLIPERVYSEEEYYEKIFAPIIRDFRKYDDKNIMEHHFLNSRGAIARFDRGAIEIRVMDIQESPLADIAIVSAVIALLRMVIDTKISTEKFQNDWSEDRLLGIFKDVIRSGNDAVINDADYLKAFGLDKSITVSALWKKLFQNFKDDMPDHLRSVFFQILESGNLSSRIINKLNNDASPKKISEVYSELAESLLKNNLFI